jgi:threonine dehydrogenase-like Zn-dependent dehydrogenase
MRALWLENGTLTLREVPMPGARGECLVRVALAGICGTDLHMRRGYADFTGIPGHEFVGIVERVEREEDRPLLGRRVVGGINVGCGACPSCRAGVEEHCETREVLGIRARHGAFAEFLALPAVNLHEVPDDLRDMGAIFTEPVAAGCRIVEQVRIAAGQRVAVLGDGRMALLTAQVLVSTRAVVTLLGRHATRIALARSLGLDARPAPSAPLAPSDRFEVVVEITGRAEGLETALGCVRPLGTIVLKTIRPHTARRSSPPGRSSSTR